MPAVRSKPPRLARPQDEAFRGLIRTFGLLERIMEPYFARFGISGAQWGVLRNLHRAEQEGLAGLRLTDLGNRLLVRPPTVTGIVDRLERAGMVARNGIPNDLRARRVGLTTKGRNLIEEVLNVHEAQIDAVMSALSRAEHGELDRLLKKLDQHLKGMTAAL